MPFLNLPNEIIISISHQQSPPDIYALCRANHRLSTLLLPELLKSVCRVDQGKTYARKALYSAARRGDTPSVRKLVNHGITKLLGNTVLHEAVRTEGELAIKTLLDSGGFDATSCYTQDWTPLCSAIVGGQPAVVRLLLQCPGADVNFRSARSPLIYLAASYADEEVMSLLLADERLLVNATDGACRTALFAGILKGKRGIVSLLLADPRTDINHRNYRGRTPLTTACLIGQSEISTLLLEDPRTEVNAADTMGRTTLHWCVQRRRLRMVRRLLACSRIEVNARDVRQCTPLFSAVAAGDIEAVRILAADARVDVNMTGERHQHPLVVAAEQELWAVVEILLQREDVDFGVLRYKAASFEDLEKSYGAATAKVIIDRLAKAKGNQVGPVA